MASRGMSEFRSNGTDYTINDPNNANEFEATENYSVGRMIYHDGDLYRFVNQHPAGAWSASDVKKASMGDEVMSNRSKIDFNMLGSLKSPGVEYVGNFHHGGDEWLGDNQKLFLYNKPITNGLKTVKVFAKTTFDRMTLLVLQKSEDDYVIVDRLESWTNSDKVAEFNNVLFKGDYYVAVSGAFIVRTDSSVTPGYIGDIRDISGDTLGTLTENTQYNIVMDVIGIPEAAEDIDPDCFEGTDSEKLQQAFDLLKLTGGTIVIRRKYVIESTITVRHEYEKNNRIIVQGMGQDAQLDIDDLYGFQGVNSSTGGVVFRDLRIYCPNPTNTCQAMLHGGNQLYDPNLINIIFENCWISNFRFIFYGANYVQSLWFIKCIIRGVSSSISNTMISTGGYQWYNVNILNCIIEGNTSIGPIGYPEAVNIKGNCIEGNSTKTCIPVVGGSKGLNIEGNYFEANLCDIDLSDINTNVRNIRIAGNYFNGSPNCIKLPSTAANVYGGTISIINNFYDGNSYLVKGESNVHYNEVFCAFNAGNITGLPATSLRVFKPEDFFSLLS